jgi:DNA-binding response OmpR family regulator
MLVFAVSSSAHRQRLYHAALDALGHQAIVVGSALQCVAELRRELPDVLLLEAPLLWGGTDGVLEVLQRELNSSVPVILVAVGTGSIDWFELSRYRIDNLLFRLPTRAELAAALDKVREHDRAFSWRTVGQQEFAALSNQ